MSQTKRAPRQTTMAVLPASAKRWFVVDADGKVVGRLATRVARVLMGKHSPAYVPHGDNGDYVVVLNASRACMTGKKPQDKKYYHNTGYPGGLRTESYAEIMSKNPERIIELAVRRMLPKTKLGEKMFGKLKVYAGAEHPHGCQNPVALEVS